MLSSLDFGGLRLTTKHLVDVSSVLSECALQHLRTEQGCNLKQLSSTLLQAEMTFKQLRLNQTVQGGFEKMVTMEGIVACHDTMVDLDCQGLVWKGGVSMQ